MSLNVKWFQFRSQWPGLTVHMGSRRLRFKRGVFITDDPTEAKHLQKRKGVVLVKTHDSDPRIHDHTKPEEPAAPQNPETPETPENPETPETPENPENDPDRPLE